MNKFEWNKNYIISMFQCNIMNRYMDSTELRHLREKRYQKYLNNLMITQQEANEYIRDRIVSQQPLAVCRNGMAETTFCTQLIHDEIMGAKYSLEHAMAVNFDKNLNQIEHYKAIISEAYREADIICGWYNIPMEEVLLKEWALCASIANTKIVGILDNEIWHAALADKKVLVISPFKEAIELQYQKRTLLHKDPNYLPAFDLKAVQAVWWYSGGRDKRFRTWFEVFDYLYEEGMKQDFDVALISCSTFSMPLVARFKKAGKQAIQLGGDLQLMFGIKGKRWDNRNDLDLYNEHWIRLTEDSKYGNVNVIDNMKGGAYW